MAVTDARVRKGTFRLMAAPSAYVGRTQVSVEGRTFSFFAGNDYHSLSSEPSVIQAARSALDEGRLSVGASRTTTGEHPIYAAWESAIARFLTSESAVVTPSGYLANLMALAAVADRFQRALVDSRAHPSLQEAARASSLQVEMFQHGNTEDLESALKTDRSTSVVLLDGVVASTGELPPLTQVAEICARYNATLLIDDCHAVGTLGERGRGTPELYGLESVGWIQTGTFSKAFGTFGGWIRASKELSASIKLTGAFVGSTPAPLPIAAAAIEAIRILSDEPERLVRLEANSNRLRRGVHQAGLFTPNTLAPIVALSWEDQSIHAQLVGRLNAAGFFAPLIHYPGGLPGGHFRFTVSSQHSASEVDALVSVLREFAADFPMERNPWHDRRQPQKG